MIQVVEQGDPALIAEIQSYVSRHPQACGDHDPRWLDVLRHGLRHRPFMLIARRAAAGDAASSHTASNGNGTAHATSSSGAAPGAICGYLPLALVASRLFGRFLVSLPYLNLAGVLADDEATELKLVDEAVRLADELNVQYLELRQGHRTMHAALGAERDEKMRMVLTLPESEEALFKMIDTKVRNQVRKGEKSGCTIRFGGLELLDDFYDVFAVNMRDLGTPVYSRELFAQVLRQMPDRAELAVVNLPNVEGAVATALLMHDPVEVARARTTQMPSASALRQYNELNPNTWMYYRLLVRAFERGSAMCDFGRSSVDSGTYRFKKKWGAEPLPTVWQYHVRFGDINAVRPDSPKYRRRVETWQKLPVWLTRLVGPAIVRGIP